MSEVCEVIKIHYDVVKAQLEHMHALARAFEEKGVDPFRLVRGTSHRSDVLPSVPLSDMEQYLRGCLNANGRLKVSELPELQLVMRDEVNLDTKQLILKVLQTVSDDDVQGLVHVAETTAMWVVHAVGQYRIELAAEALAVLKRIFLAKVFDYKCPTAAAVRRQLVTALGNLPRTTASIPKGTIVHAWDVKQLPTVVQEATLLADVELTRKARERLHNPPDIPPPARPSRASLLRDRKRRRLPEPPPTVSALSTLMKKVGPDA